jgi:hypothetical protein
MAHPSVGPDPDHNVRLWSDTALGWPCRADSAGRRGFDPAGREALARRGATPTTAMTHIAIQEQLDGKTADWMEKVSDEQYHA